MTTDPNNKWAQDAKKYAGYAKQAADKLAAYQKESAKLQEAGSTLSDIQKIAAGMSWASKLSMGLGVMSMGFTAIAALLPVPSTEDQILDGVKQLKDQVSELRDHINVLVKQLKGHVDQSIIEDLMMVVHFSSIESATDMMASAATRSAHPSIGSADDYYGKLRRYEGDLAGALTAIELVVTAKDEDRNILRLTANTSHGDVRKVTRVGMQYLNMATACMAAEGARQLLRQEHEQGRAFSDEEKLQKLANIAGRPDIASDPSAQLARITEAVQAQIDHCMQRSVREAYVASYYDETIAPLADTLPTTHQLTADRIVGMLTAHYPYLNFTAIVYDGVSDEGDGKRHGWAGSGPDWGLITRMQVPLPGKSDSDDAEDKRNTIIYFMPRYLNETPETQYLGILDRPSPARNSACSAMSGNLNVHKHDGLHTQWKKIRYNNEKLSSFIKSEYGPVWAGHKDWGNDFVWICYTDVDTETVDYKSMSGVGLDHKAQNMMKTFVGISTTNSIGMVTRRDANHTMGTISHLHHWEFDCRYYQVVVLWQTKH